MGIKRIAIILIFLTRIVFSSSIEITKVGEWGTSYYEDVFVQGNYAYCAAYYSGLDIIDIGSKEHPKKIGNYDIWTSEAAAAYGVKVKGNYAYVAYDRGLIILDISNPAYPKYKGKYETSVNYYTTDVYLKDNYAYIISNGGGLHVVDITNPQAPALMGKIETYWANGLYVEGTYAYITDFQDGLMIIDISDPRDPKVVGTCVGFGRRGLYVKDNYAYVANEQNGLEVVDISDPSSPKPVGNYNTPGYARNVSVRGKYAYVADYQEGLVVIDISQPASPKYAGSYNTIGTAWGGLCLIDQFAFVADFDHGLQIIDISTPETPTWVGSYDESGIAESLFVKDKYVYLADNESGLRIIDVSVPSAPAQVGNYDTSDRALGIHVTEGYAYLAVDTNGLQVIDVSRPASPTLTGIDKSITYALDVYVNGDYAYIACGFDGLRVVNIADPGNPYFTGGYSLSSYTTGVYVSGNYAYVSNRGNGILIFDVSQPSSPVQVGSYVTPGNASGLYVRDKYVYVADDRGFVILDVSTPTSPMIVGRCSTPECAEKLHVSGNYAFVADSYGGVLIIDIENPSYPGIVAKYDTKGYVEDVYVNGNYIYVADGLIGKLIILKVSGLFPNRPNLSMNRNRMNFGAEKFGKTTNSQCLLIDNTGDGSMDWTVEKDKQWIHCSPTSGTNAGSVTVSVDASGLAAGDYSGMITVSSPNATDSPQTVAVTLTVYGTSQTSGPFGCFDTPGEGATVCSSVPFTGWVLDDIGVEHVKLYRQGEKELIYIGDSVFVEGARPDVEGFYPQYPNNYKAGWGYMMLSNFLPNKGNGIFTIHAIATDTSGHQVTLGTRTITVNNKDAFKPFGTIDTPLQGGTASGANYVNFGWALTPQPNAIPPDGSTIKVWIDGVPQSDNPVYNQYREDLFRLFPEYNNSEGACGYYYLDTTQFANGVHTIAWSVRDDAGNSDGIGSRYFNIINTSPKKPATRKDRVIPLDISSIPMDDPNPVRIVTGNNDDVPREIYPDQNNIFHIDIKELERLEIHFAGSIQLLSKQPIGSFLDNKKNIFYWQAGPGFLGEYLFLFLEKRKNGDFGKNYISITIHSKFANNTYPEKR